MMQSLRSAWQARWSQASAREQTLVRVALSVLLLAALWFIALRPAWVGLKAARAQAPVVRAQYEQVLQLQAQANALRAQASGAPVDAKTVLQSALSGLEKNARLAVQAERATVSFKDAKPEALARFLEQARLTAHASTQEMHLSQGGGLWTGNVVLLLPAPGAP
jgi:general secretion pathway protein M